MTSPTWGTGKFGQSLSGGLGESANWLTPPGAFTIVLNGWLAATTNTKIILLRPFSGRQAANLQAAIAGCSNPSRCDYIDTAGFFNSDALRPYGFANIADIAPKVAAAVRPLLTGIPITAPAQVYNIAF